MIRAPSFALGVAMAQAVATGGFRLIEITWNSEQPAHLVDHLRHVLPSHCQVGAGTILTPDAMQEAIAAGAQFCFSPHTDSHLLAIAQDHAIPCIPGALTPTEIVQAWQLGASSVKVFPCQAVGGATYIRHLQGPLSHIPLIPTGGIALEDGYTFLAAGAIAIGVASSLFPRQLVAQENWWAIAQQATTFLKHLEQTNRLPTSTR